MAQDHPDVIERLIELTSLPRADAAKVAQAGRLVNVPARWSLIWEKTPADHAYLLLSGEVSIMRDRKEIARLGPGEILGEVAIISRRLRTASVITEEPVTALTFDADRVRSLSEQIPAVAEALRSNTIERLGSTNNSAT